MSETPEASTHDAATSRIIRACRGENHSRPPVWIMRQAGRYLPEYQQVRQRRSFAEMCGIPEIAVEVSLQPYRRFKLDGVIVFYDILFLPQAMGAPLEFSDKGPAFLQPLRDRRAIESLHTPDLAAEDPARGTGAVLRSLETLRQTVPRAVTVLGFAGAPFTLAAYLVEGNFQRSGDRIRRMMHEDPQAVHLLLERLTDATGQYLSAQVEAGADVVQLFDTWAGLLDVADYEEFALPYEQRIFEVVAATGAPTILYVNGCSHLLRSLSATGATGLSVDWRVPLGETRRIVGADTVLQGNLDPSSLFAAPRVVRAKTRHVLDSMAGDPRYIFNLGHGILPETPLASVETMVETVRSYGEG